MGPPSPTIFTYMIMECLFFLQCLLTKRLKFLQRNLNVLDPTIPAIIQYLQLLQILLFGVGSWSYWDSRLQLPSMRVHVQSHKGLAWLQINGLWCWVQILLRNYMHDFETMVKIRFFRPHPTMKSPDNHIGLRVRLAIYKLFSNNSIDLLYIVEFSQDHTSHHSHSLTFNIHNLPVISPTLYASTNTPSYTTLVALFITFNLYASLLQWLSHIQS